MALLTVTEFRALSPSSLGEDALQLLLDAAEAEIVAFAGPADAALELLTGSSRFIALARPADTITSISETVYSTATTLATDDYLIHPGGYLIERLSGGTNSRSRWYGRVAVTYVPVDDESIRKSVQLDLVNIMTTYTPGLSSETVGSWTTQIGGDSQWNNAVEREAILGRLVAHGRMAVV